MNYTSDELFNKYILNGEKYFSDYERDRIIEDIILLQELLEPLGILKKTININKLNIDNHSLFLIHTWQNELYAIKYFKQSSRNPPTQNIFGVYV